MTYEIIILVVVLALCVLVPCGVGFIFNAIFPAKDTALADARHSLAHYKELYESYVDYLDSTKERAMHYFNRARRSDEKCQRHVRDGEWYAKRITHLEYDLQTKGVEIRSTNRTLDHYVALVRGLREELDDAQCDHCDMHDNIEVVTDPRTSKYNKCSEDYYEITTIDRKSFKPYAKDQNRRDRRNTRVTLRHAV